MARVYKEFKQNEKVIKKWVEKYIAFEFDEDGNIISDTSKYGAKTDEYDEQGNRTDFPCCFSDDNSNIYEKTNYERTSNVNLNPKIETFGNLIIKDTGCKKIIWKTTDGIEVYSLLLFYSENFQKEIDKDNNLIYIKNGDDEYFFDYDENKLIHLKEIESYAESFEKWFEYDGEKLEHSKDSDNEESFYRYNSNGRLIYERNWKNKNVDDDGENEYEDDTWVNETEYEYNSNGNLFHKITTEYDFIEDYDYGNTSSIKETWFEYDASGKKTLSRDSDGNIIKWDSFGNIIYEKNNSGEYKNEYNSSGIMIHSIHKITQDKKEDYLCYPDRNYEKKWNDNGDLIFCYYSNEKEIFEYKESFEYNEKNKLIHYIQMSKNDNEASKYEEWYEYNDEVLIHKKCSDGEEYKYNSQGKLIYYRGLDLETYWNECDLNGNPIHFKSDEVEEWYEYEFYDNGNVKKKICYRAI